MAYVTRYVAFVDILGFREIINKSRTSERMVEELAKSLKSMGDRNTDLERTLGVDFKSQTFSDCIIMSEAASEKGLSHLLYQIQELGLSLLAKGILIRSGICKGGLYHEGSVVFGPAIIEAYRLESSVANFPRVILDGHGGFETLGTSCAKRLTRQAFARVKRFDLHATNSVMRRKPRCRPGTVATSERTPARSDASTEGGQARPLLAPLRQRVDEVENVRATVMICGNETSIAKPSSSFR